MDKRKVRALLKRVHRHARDNCALHTGNDGCLATRHRKCVLSFDCDRVCGNVCPYFMRSVLPVDEQLFHDYIEHFPDDYPLKPDAKSLPDVCERCGGRYKKASNRQKYCASCRVQVRKEQAKRRMKNKRIKDAVN